VVCTFADPDGNSFSLMSQDDLSKRMEVERRTALERAEHERLAAHDMEIAREFQTRLFPSAQSSLRTLDFAGRCIQARQVGGDYFDCLPLGAGYLGLVIGDISGKGIAAALLMANLQAVVRGQSALAAHNPAGFVHAVNKHLCENTTPASVRNVVFWRL
jgi:serine phosphatase RsbU (regulator of sigma subunit)